MFNFEDLLTAGGDVVQGFFGIDPDTEDSILGQIGTAAGNILGFDPESEDSFAAQVGQALGGIIGLGGSPGGILGGGGSGGLLGSGGIGGLLAAGVPAYYLGKAAMEEAKNQTGVPLIPLTQETGAGRYNIEAEIRRRMGLPAPDPVEFGMLPRGTLPELTGGRPRPAGGERVSYELASRTVPDLEVSPALRRGIPSGGMEGAGIPYNPVPQREAGSSIVDRALAFGDRIASENMNDQSISEFMTNLFGKTVPVQRYRKGGIVSLAEGGSPMVEIEIETEDGEMMDADEFERMNGSINGEGTEISDDVPAMLSDGEYVMTGRAVRGAGAYDLNVGDGGIITLTPGGEESRERGTDLMYQMMALFEEFAGAPEEDD